MLRISRHLRYCLASGECLVHFNANISPDVGHLTVIQIGICNRAGAGSICDGNGLIYIWQTPGWRRPDTGRSARRLPNLHVRFSAVLQTIYYYCWRVMAPPFRESYLQTRCYPKWCNLLMSWLIDITSIYWCVLHRKIELTKIVTAVYQIRHEKYRIPVTLFKDIYANKM